MGVAGSRRILEAGANDLGGTLMDENISRAAGATHGQAMDVDMLRGLVHRLTGPCFNAARSIKPCERQRLRPRAPAEIEADTPQSPEKPRPCANCWRRS